MDRAEVLYRELAPGVLGYLRASGAAEPEDRLGEVFLHVARDLHRFRGRDDPVAVRRWVFTIARNRATDAARRSRRRPAIAHAEVPDLEDARHIEEPLDADLVTALRSLTLEQREVLVLRFVADLALEDVASITRRSVGAVKAMQHRALESLREAVSRGGPLPL